MVGNLSALEEIEAAIAKLTSWEDEYWIAYDDEGITALRSSAGSPVGIDFLPSDAEIAVILRRTAEPQIEILREAKVFAENSEAIGMPESEIVEYYGATLELARAINGVHS